MKRIRLALALFWYGLRTGHDPRPRKVVPPPRAPRAPKPVEPPHIQVMRDKRAALEPPSPDLVVKWLVGGKERVAYRGPDKVRAMRAIEMGESRPEVAKVLANMNGGAGGG